MTDLNILRYELLAYGVPAELINNFEKTLLEDAANNAVTWCNTHHCAHSKGEDDIAHAIMDTNHHPTDY